jgi:hypothetical protein
MKSLPRHRRLLPCVVLVALVGAVVVGVSSPGSATTVTPSKTVTGTPTEPGFSPTPTATPSPQRTGDLGTKLIIGHVYDASGAGDTPIADATVVYGGPHGVGSVETDLAGEFRFSLFLHDTDLVGISATAAGFHDGANTYTGLQLWFETTPVQIRLIAVEPGTHRVSGVVHRDPLCSADLPITVELTEVGSSDPQSSTLAPPSGAFVFDGVRDGDYVVSAASDCHPSGYTPVTVHVDGADVVEVELESDWCPSELMLDPTHGLPGTIVDLVGRCYYIHSGGLARIHLDDLLLAEVHAETGGDYHAQIRIPDDTNPGAHAVNVTNASGTTIGSGNFYVNAQSPGPCRGDCDRDGEVRVDELLTMIDQALGHFTPLGCPAAAPDGGGRIEISGIVAAVNSALHGCPGPQFGTCYESAACDPYRVGPYEPFSSSRANCCHLQSTEGGVPFSFCPAEAFDGTTGECTQCANPC